MSRFFNRYFSLSRIEVSRRPCWRVNEQISLLVRNEKIQESITKGWSHVASCLGVHPEKLRIDDTVKYIRSLDWTEGGEWFELEKVIKKISSVPLPDEFTLIELADMVGQAVSIEK